MAKKETQTDKMNPDQVVLNKIQQKRFSLLTGIDEREIAGKSIAQLSDTLKWRIDLRHLFFERICGRVVKKDPVTGEEYAVPFATVYIEDTDCNLISYHPAGYPWSWHFPFFCHREVIGSTQTDACGNFCIWIPRFDIDWILRWRRERICFPVIFKRPIFRDFIPKPDIPPLRNPGDPGPWEEFNKLSPSILESVVGSKAGNIVKEISRLKNSLTSGMMVNDKAEGILNQRAFDNEMPPPLPADFQKVISGHNVVASKGASAADAIRTAIAGQLGLGREAADIEGFNYRNYIGPFYRCIDFYVPVWQQVLDVPDITFRVTQDTNGDGIEETIYSEGYFDVRWDSGPISNVTLVASSIAKESHFCHVPPVPCGNVPALLYAGFMPLEDASYFDDVNGYALRPNKPRPLGVSTFPAQTPFCATVAFYGCVDISNATYYRVLQSIDEGVSYSPVTGLAWNNYPNTIGAPIPIVPDMNGWYPVEPIDPVTLNPVPRASLEFPNLVLEWPTPSDAKSLLKIELGDSAKTHLAESAVVAVTSDNTYPNLTTTQWSWKYVGEPDAMLRSLLGIDCPMIKRGAIPRDIELVFEVNVQAHHLRDAYLATSGCGGGSFLPIADAANNPSHWHTAPTDNSVMLYQRYSLSAGSLPGCYAFESRANSRSMNPSGGDGGNLLPTDWNYDPIFIYSDPSRSVAVVNEDLP